MHRLQHIYEIDELPRLKEFLLAIPDGERLREDLFAEFARYCCYRDAEEWNRAVRICECLAIVGWGEREPLEAVRGTYFNGNPNTYFLNRDSRPRCFDAVWSKRVDGYAVDFSRSEWHDSPDSSLRAEELSKTGIGGISAESLKSQRNWIAKNPILITRGLANCYENSRPMIESLEKELMPELNRRMRPEVYGEAIDRIVLHCCFSFYDDYHCKTNYIVAEESLKLKQKDFYPVLLTMFTEKEIEDNGYYLRNRFTYSPFRADNGTARVVIVFEKEFSDLPQQKQREVISGYFLQAVSQLEKRLSKKIEYDFQQLISDFKEILAKWQSKSP